MSIWAITEDGAAALDTRMQKNIKSQATEPFDAGGMAVMKIHGPLFARSDWVTESLGIKSTEFLMSEFSDLEKRHGRILLDIDGPGGEVDLMFEFADMIKNSSSEISAYVGGSAYSADFLLFMAAHKRYAHRAAGLGSMGVISYTPYERSNVVVSSNAKNKIPNRDEVQASIDDYERKFVDAVAEAMGKTPAEAIKLAREGGTFQGDYALNNGFIHELTTFNSLISEIKGGQSAPEDDLTEEEARALAESAVEANNERWKELLSCSRNIEAVVDMATTAAMPIDVAKKMLGHAAKPEEAETGQKDLAEIETRLAGMIREMQIAASNTENVENEADAQSAEIHRAKAAAARAGL